MGKRFVIIAAAVVVLASLAMGISMAQSSKATVRDGEDRIHVVIGPGAKIQFFDFNNDGLTLGDRLASYGPIFNESQKERVGTHYVDCFVATKVLKEGKPYDCTYVLKLREGDIMTQGLDPHGVSDVFFAVTGGTGAYEGATGQAEYIDTDVTDIIIDLDD